MIKKLKLRFITLAMVSLTVLLAIIVAGMNIISYQKVVSDADARIEVLEQNSYRFHRLHSGSSSNDGFGRLFDDDRDGDFFFGRKGPGGPSMTKDEAEESRFFSVTVDEDGNVKQLYMDRIYAVDSTEAGDYADTALSGESEKGFVDDFRYSVTESNGYRSITFLDCSTILDSYRDFLRASILMSLAGLLVVFAVICYFAGRIVRPVAESYEKQKRFITDAGHEIKTPLAIIKANIDLMNMELDGGLSEDPSSGSKDSISAEGIGELKDSLGDINDQIDRLAGLTNDLVYLSRMEEADNSLVLTEVPLSDIVSESVAAFEPLAAEKGKLIEADIEPMITIKGSNKELEKLMSIILENAVKYSALPQTQDDEDSGDEDEEGMPPVPRIDVSLRKDGRNAVIEVSNASGTELTNESLSHVFERFYRTDSSRNSQTGGHGIGLSVAQAIVTAHGGKISARTTDGHDFIITASIALA